MIMILCYKYPLGYPEGYYCVRRENMRAKRIGVLLTQIGTPDAPTTTAVRRYLRHFLSDQRVVDYHPWFWKPLLYSIILTFRPKRSAALYKEIWTEAGSPLRIHMVNQQQALQKMLGDHYRVELGLAYSEPSIKQALSLFREEGIQDITVLPLFPQYSSSTTASIYDTVYFEARGGRGSKVRTLPRFIPTLRFIGAYYDHPLYIHALAEHLREHVSGLSYVPDQYIFTFHGVPQRYIKTGDPYYEQCEVTAKLLASELGLGQQDWIMSFQSKFGPEPWITPATFDIINDLPAKGIKAPVIFAPGFAADCLETIHELGIEGREVFINAGGSVNTYTVIPCLNDSDPWITLLASLVRQEAINNE